MWTHGVARDQPAGEYTVFWNGKDGQGREAASGAYFYLNVPHFSQAMDKMSVTVQKLASNKIATARIKRQNSHFPYKPIFTVFNNDKIIIFNNLSIAFLKISGDIQVLISTTSGRGVSNRQVDALVARKFITARADSRNSKAANRR